MDSSDHSTLFHFASVHLRSSGPEKLAAFLGVVDIWLSLCMVEFELTLVDVACELTMVFRSVPEPT